MLEASFFYQIDPLQQHCWDYLHTHVTPDNVLALYTAAFRARLPSMPKEVETKIWEVIANESEAVLASDAFVSCSVEIMVQLVKLDHFLVKETALWSRCLQWAEAQQEALSLALSLSLLASYRSSPHSAHNPHMQQEASQEVPQGAAAACTSTGSLPKTAQESMGLLIPHFHFPVMDPEFFLDHVQSHLTRAHAEEITAFFIAKRVTSFSKFPRFVYVTPPRLYTYHVISEQFITIMC